MIEYLILPEHQLTLIWKQGEISVDECITLIREIQADPDHSPDFDVLTDVSETITAFSSEEILEMVQVSNALKYGKRDKRNAIIAPADRTYGPSRMYEQLSSGTTPFETAVFRDLASALKWLDKDPAALAKHLKSEIDPSP